MARTPIALIADDVETLSESCPSRYEGTDVATGDLVSIRFSRGTVTVTRNHAKVFEDKVPDAADQSTCSLDQTCAAAGIDLLTDG